MGGLDVLWLLCPAQGQLSGDNGGSLLFHEGYELVEGYSPYHVT